MKNILNLFVILFLLFASCTKEELNIVDEPVELDENSPEFQTYPAERARGFIKMYRFEKLDGVLDRLTDPAIRDEVMVLYREYKKKAETEGLFFVTEEQDSLYFLIPPRYEPIPPAEQTWLGLVFDNSPYMVNSKGILQGFYTYPKVETFIALYPLATGLKDLEYMPALKRFEWNIDPNDFAQRFPTEEFKPTRLQTDFSKNNKLETMQFQYVDISDLVFPDVKISSISLQNCVINGNDNLNNINANQLTITGNTQVSRPDLIIKNTGLDSIAFQNMRDQLKTLDIQSTHIKKIDIPSGLEKVILNEGLTQFNGDLSKLNQAAVFPVSLETLAIGDYAFDKNLSQLLNLSHLQLTVTQPSDVVLPVNLKSIRLDGDIAGINYPVALKSFTTSHVTGDLDLSESNIEEVNFDQATIQGKILLPNNLKEINIRFTRFDTEKKVDLSQSTTLDFLHFYSYSPITLVLPDHLSEQAVKAGVISVNSTSAAIFLPIGSTIENAPEWLFQYVHVGNL